MTLSQPREFDILAFLWWEGERKFLLFARKRSKTPEWVVTFVFACIATEADPGVPFVVPHNLYQQWGENFPPHLSNNFAAHNQEDRYQS